LEDLLSIAGKVTQTGSGALQTPTQWTPELLAGAKQQVREVDYLRT